MTLVDTHCHIHDSEFASRYEQSQDELIEEAKKAGVETLICVGTEDRSNHEAVAFCKDRENCHASVALHPHEAEDFAQTGLEAQLKRMDELLSDKNCDIVAIGECGLDYFYHESDEVISRQKWLLREHLQRAQAHNLPVIFHVRDAFDDFFEVFDEFPGIQGVIHSFSATQSELEGCLRRGLYIGLNGIMTFTKVPEQLEAAKAVPLDKLLLETDAPFLTPKPFRGKICKPEHVACTAQFLGELRGESLDEIAAITTKNAKKLFSL